MALPKLVAIPFDWKTPNGELATPEFLKLIQDKTISWWRQNRRNDLPWRLPCTGHESPFSESPDPYKIWVSEVMSQQTQMGTVIKYFNQWMDRFPTIEALARSTEEEVRSVWSGMGYYRRATYLRKGAQYLVSEHEKSNSGGAVSLPNTSAKLMKVPGIGPYTAAAIASICFGETKTSVDGNVFRVLCRLRGEKQMDPKIAKNLRLSYLWGEQLMRGKEEAVCAYPGDLNQGLMELGASICKPTGPPNCRGCPLRDHCVASNAYERKELPAIEGVIPLHGTSVPKRVDEVLTVIHEFTNPSHSPSRFVMVRRPSTGLLGGMLEFPSLTLSSSVCGQAHRFHEENEALASLSCLSKKGVAGNPRVLKAGKVVHIFSHIHMTIHVYHTKWLKKHLDQANDFTEEERVMNCLANVLDKANGQSGSRASIFALCSDELSSTGLSRLLLKVLNMARQSEQHQTTEEKKLKRRRTKE